MNILHRESDAAVELAASQWVGRHDAGMTLSEKLEFERWKAADPRHMQAYARHEQTWRCFDRPLAGGQATAMIEALAASKTMRQRRRTRRLAAGLATCGLAGLLWYHAGSGVHREAPGAVLAANATVMMPEKRALPDGSIVELKPGSVINVAFDSNARRVILESGEAFFRVVNNPQSFVVSARGVGVRAVGTAFSVLLKTQTVEVLVTEGTVAVEESRGPEDGRRITEDARKASVPADSVPHSFASPAPSFSQSFTPVLVDAGNRALIDVVQQAPAMAVISPVTPPDMAERLAWRKTRLEFTDTPLATAADLFNRHSAREETHRLVVDPKDLVLARTEVSGYFDADNVDAFVLLIEQTLGIEADRQAGKIFLRRAQ